MKKYIAITISILALTVISLNAFSYDSYRKSFTSQSSAFNSYDAACKKAWHSNNRKLNKFKKDGYRKKGRYAYIGPSETARRTFRGSKKDKRGRRIKFCKLTNAFEVYHPGTFY